MDAILPAERVLRQERSLFEWLVTNRLQDAMNIWQAFSDTATSKSQNLLPSSSRGCNRVLRCVTTPFVPLDNRTPLRSRSGCTTYTKTISNIMQPARTINAVHRCPRGIPPYPPQRPDDHRINRVRHNWFLLNKTTLLSLTRD